MLDKTPPAAGLDVRGDRTKKILATIIQGERLHGRATGVLILV